MRRSLALVLALLPPLAAEASVPVASGPAPMLAVGFAAPPATIACAEGSARLVEGAAPPARAWRPWVPPVAMTSQRAGERPAAPVPPLAPPASAVLTFSVDADGRVIDLARPGGREGLAPGWASDDEVAVVASWRFAPGAPAKGCRFDLAPAAVPVEQASPARLFEILADQGRSAPAAVRQAAGAGGDCDRAPRRRPHVVVYPDLRGFDDKTVDPSWAGIAYDVDAGGAVRDVRVVAQHGEAAFADAAAGAVAEARFFPGSPRTGCFAAFKARAKTTEASGRPESKSFKRPGDSCEVTREALNIPEAKGYPPAFGKRRVAGWAILRFDVAPWGQIGSVEVLAAQPAAVFGEMARSLLMAARPSPPPSGYRGCVVPVIYAIPPSVPDED